jgi:hypothetical protein
MVRYRALAFLAGCPDGCAETLLVVNGFTVDLMVEVVRDGLASATPERVVSGRACRRGGVLRLERRASCSPSDYSFEYEFLYRAPEAFLKTHRLLRRVHPR